MSYAIEREKELMGQVIPMTKNDDFESFWADKVINL